MQPFHYPEAVISDRHQIQEQLVFTKVTVRAYKADCSQIAFQMLARIDSAVELRYWQGGGILQTVLREMVRISDFRFDQ